MMLTDCTLYFECTISGRIEDIEVHTVWFNLDTSADGCTPRHAKFAQKRAFALRRHLVTWRNFFVVLPAAAPPIQVPFYPVFDPRIVSDFAGALRRSAVPPLFADLRSRADQPKTAENYFGSALPTGA